MLLGCRNLALNIYLIWSTSTTLCIVLYNTRRHIFSDFFDNLLWHKDKNFENLSQFQELKELSDPGFFPSTGKIRPVMPLDETAAESRDLCL